MPDMAQGNEGTNESRKRRPEEYRTRSKADGVMNADGGSIPVITDGEYRHAISAVPDKTAFILPISKAVSEMLTFREGRLNDEYHLSFPDDFSPERLAGLDFAVLGSIYGIILKSIERQIQADGTPEGVLAILEDPRLEYTVKLYVPDFLRMLGMDPNQSVAQTMKAIGKLQAFNRIIGIHREVMPYGKVYDSQYAVILWHDYSTKNNTIRFSSPYLNHIARTIIRKNMAMDQAGLPDMPAGGQPRVRACHSYLLNPVLASERNYPAVEIVTYVIRLIETAGDKGTPNASAQNILDECPELKRRCEAMKGTSDKNKALKRAFDGALRILGDEKYTSLTSKYKNLRIQTPDGGLKWGKLDKAVFKFPHEGKIKTNKADSKPS